MDLRKFRKKRIINYYIGTDEELTDLIIQFQKESCLKSQSAFLRDLLKASLMFGLREMNFGNSFEDVIKKLKDETMVHSY